VELSLKKNLEIAEQMKKTGRRKGRETNLGRGRKSITQEIKKVSKTRQHARGKQTALGIAVSVKGRLGGYNLLCYNSTWGAQDRKALMSAFHKKKPRLGGVKYSEPTSEGKKKKGDPDLEHREVTGN